MMNEKVNFNRSESDKTGIQLIDNEIAIVRNGFIGEVFDTIRYPDGHIEKREKSFNVVVDSVSKLIAALIKFDSTYSAGNLYWALGTGNATWDTTPFTPSSSDTQLTNEVFRKAITTAQRSFVDASGNKISTLSNRIQLDISIDSGDANGNSLREFGIFGGNATSALNSGVMINHKAHSRIDKVDGMTITRSVRFTF